MQVDEEEASGANTVPTKNAQKAKSGGDSNNEGSSSKGSAVNQQDPVYHCLKCRKELALEAAKSGKGKPGLKDNNLNRGSTPRTPQ